LLLTAPVFASNVTLLEPSPDAPTINLLLKSGVPFEPLQRTHPDGIAETAPDHIIIPPDGTEDPAPPIIP